MRAKKDRSRISTEGFEIIPEPEDGVSYHKPNKKLREKNNVEVTKD